MVILHPIPSVIQGMMTDPTCTLKGLADYLSPNESDIQEYRSFELPNILVLQDNGIKSFVDLREEQLKILSKSSSLSSSIRKRISALYELYVLKYENASKYYEIIPKELRQKENQDHYIVEEIDQTMKLNLIKLNNELRTNGEALLTETAIASDMQVVYDHYKKGTNAVPDELKPHMEEFKPIEFCKAYLSKLLGLDLKFAIDGSAVRVTI